MLLLVRQKSSLRRPLTWLMQTPIENSLTTLKFAVKARLNEDVNRNSIADRAAAAQQEQTFVEYCQI